MKFMKVVGPEGLEPGDVGWGGLLGYPSSPAAARTVPGMCCECPPLL